MELWIPFPQSNEVQEISNVKLNTNGLNYTIKDEKVHGNKYLYINNKSGTLKSTTITMIFLMWSEKNIRMLSIKMWTLKNI